MLAKKKNTHKKSASREKNLTPAQFKGTAWGKVAGRRSLQITAFLGKPFLHTLIRCELILAMIQSLRLKFAFSAFSSHNEPGSRQFCNPGLV